MPNVEPFSLAIVAPAGMGEAGESAVNEAKAPLCPIATITSSSVATPAVDTATSNTVDHCPAPPTPGKHWSFASARPAPYWAR